MISTLGSVLRLGLLLLLALTFTGCESWESKEEEMAAFDDDLQSLKEFFQIPGISAMVVQHDKVLFEQHYGFANLEDEVKVGASTAFPIASITKLYSATLIMKLVEDGKLSLEDPVNQYIEESGLSDSIKVKHLLSHTSQGEIGEQFFYSFRFGYLTPIIETAAGMPFNEAMEAYIFKSAGLEKTFLLKDSTQLASKEIIMASPYFLEEEPVPGFIDYGYSASAGIVSTPADIVRFNKALDDDLLISKESKQAMFTGLRNDLPYAYGCFKQKINGIEVVWVYGQYDCFSSLLIKVPEKDLTMVLLANNSHMSDPARLIMGDLTSSLFALSFLKIFVFNEMITPGIHLPERAYAYEYNFDLHRRQILAEALATSFMARFSPNQYETIGTIENSSEFLRQTIQRYPDYLSYGNINTLHTFSFLKDVAFYMEIADDHEFDNELETLGLKLLEKEPNNPYLHIYLGTFYDRAGDKEKARFHFQSIVDMENFSPFWYTREAESWLAEHP